MPKSPTEDENGLPSLRRELIRLGNRKEFTAEAVLDLLTLGMFMYSVMPDTTAQTVLDEWETSFEP